jgi:hypothetical protein
MAWSRGIPEQQAWREQAWTMAAMSLVFVAGFSVQLASGRSSFDAPAIVHAHALIFFGWVGLSILLAGLAASGRIEQHRRLGWVGAGWMLAMMVAGPAVTIAAVRSGRTPFFFQPQPFLFQDIATLLCFFGLAGAAIALRRETGWHRRLHLSALATLMGPAFGRLLPMPLLGAHAFEIAALPGLLFPLGLAIREGRGGLGLHPAWILGLAALPLTLAAVSWFAPSPAGTALYEAIVAGSPMAGRTGFPLSGAPGPGLIRQAASLPR